MSDYSQQEQQLLRLRDELQQRLDAVNRDLSRSHSADSEERATERENDDTLNSLAAEAQDQLTQINRALERMHAGQYGHCEKCGQSIDTGRLQAVPFATLCIRCAEGSPHAH